MKNIEPTIIYRYKPGGYFEFISEVTCRITNSEMIIYRNAFDTNYKDVQMRPKENFHYNFRLFKEFKGLKSFIWKHFPNMRHKMLMNTQFI